MKIILLILFTLSNALAFDCSGDNGITKVSGGYLYSPECHVKVGKLVVNSKSQAEEIVALRKAIELKDLAFDKQTERVKIWQDTTLSLERSVLTQQRFNRLENWAYFGLGIILTGLAVTAANGISK